MKKETEINKMLALYLRANEEYYRGNPMMSDIEFDKLHRHLEELSLTNPKVRSTISKVGGTAGNIEHVPPMFSIKDAFNKEELDAFLKTTFDARTILSPKVDGMSGSLIYINGELIMAVSRGDGKLGNSILKNATMVSNIPKLIPMKGKITVRGEFYIPKDSNIEGSLRNIVSGTMMGKDPDKVTARGVKFIAWDCYVGDNVPYSSKFTILENQGFDVVETVNTPHKKAFNTINEWNWHQFPFEIDGVVLHSASHVDVKRLGYVGKYPKYKLAYKFPEKSEITKLIGIEWNVGTMGLLAPVAILEPVVISNTTVSRVTLHNIDIMDKLGIYIGCEVEIIKAGEIIPKILKVITPRKDAYDKPSKCPSCDKPVVEMKGSDKAATRLLCVNVSCLGTLHKRLIRFANRDNFKIDALADRTIMAGVESGLFRTPLDILQVTKAQLVELKSPKMADKIFNNISASKTITLGRFISALNIPNLGRTISDKLAEMIGETNPTISVVLDALRTIIGVDSVVYNNAQKWFSNNSELYYNMLDEITIKVKNKVKTTNDDYKNMKVSITGKFPKSRDAIKLEIIAGGGTVTPLGTSTDLFLIGDKPGPDKIRRAEALNINTIKYGE